MYEKNSNLTSIVIAIISILLILSGVFLLNRRFNSNDSLAQNTRSSTVSSSSSKSLVLSSSSSSSSKSSSSANFDIEIDDNTDSDRDRDSELVNVSKSISSSSSKDIASSKSIDSNSSSNKANISSSSSAGKFNLNQNQILAKAISPDSNGNNFEIIECGIKNAFYCKPGKKIRMEGDNYKVGQNYLMTGNIQDSQNGISLTETIIRPYTQESSSSASQKVHRD